MPRAAVLRWRRFLSSVCERPCSAGPPLPQLHCSWPYPRDPAQPSSIITFAGTSYPWLKFVPITSSSLSSSSSPCPRPQHYQKSNAQQNSSTNSPLHSDHIERQFRIPLPRHIQIRITPQRRIFRTRLILILNIDTPHDLQPLLQLIS